jgi:hypothetical protein
MKGYSYALIQDWLQSMIKHHPDDEIKQEAEYLLKMFKTEAYKKHRSYMIEFIDTNKIETITHTPIIIK